MVTVPDGICGVTPEWLSEALDRPVLAVTVTPLGIGQTGCTYRLALDGGTTLVAKTVAEDPAVQGEPIAAEQCADAVRGQYALGCDGVILHGCTLTELAPVVRTLKES